jgi:phosphohistidine phosphatase
MRRLLLLRHAKAAPFSFGDDFDRELTDRGRADAQKIGEWMAEADVIPDNAIYSGSARTKATFEIVTRALPGAIAAKEENALYEATWRLILALLGELPATSRASLVVGHNPGIGDVANMLAGEGIESERSRLASKFPTGALAVIAFHRDDWKKISPRAGKLERFVTPADL